MVATFLFLITILGVTRKGTPLHIAGFAGLAIGLTLAVIHIVGINVTGVSVNPARSLGPALFTGGTALAQLWLFIVAPLAGAIIAGAVYRSGVLWGDDSVRRPMAGAAPDAAPAPRGYCWEQYCCIPDVSCCFSVAMRWV